MSLETLLLSLKLLFNPYTIFLISVAGSIGLLVGAIPGLNDTNILAMLLPFVVFFDPLMGIIAMTAIYVGSQTAGSIPAILINVPGTPSAAATCLEGYLLTKKGLQGQALGASFFSSLVGGVLGGLLALFLSPILGKYALSFGPPEMFMVAIFGMTAVGSLTGKTIIKGLLSAVFGLLVATTGLDFFTGVPRATFGILQLYDGIPLIPALLGLYGLSELFFLVDTKTITSSKNTAFLGLSAPIEGIKYALKYKLTMIRSCIIGWIIGVIPGAGATIASFTSYGQARQWSKNPETFGTGNFEGLVATDTANNASVPGSLVPLLTLGIPGSGTTIIILAAFMIHGLRPGPGFFASYIIESNAIFLTIILVGFFTFFLGILATKILSKVSYIPTRILIPYVLSFCILGGFVWRNYVADLFIMLSFAIIGVIFKRYGYSAPAFLLGLILGPLAEPNLFRSLIIAHGNPTIFVTRPICITLLILTVISLFVPVFLHKKTSR